MPRFIVYEIQNQLQTHRYRFSVEAADPDSAIAAAIDGAEGEYLGMMGEPEYLPQIGRAALPDTGSDTDHHSGWLLALAELQRQEAASQEPEQPA